MYLPGVPIDVISKNHPLIDVNYSTISVHIVLTTGYKQTLTGYNPSLEL
jgi:hypothetical protein